ncbi:uncharacterized protein LOC119330896 isoform X7 [Triticum dicoccoides]|uniref:uncharacterized protein LOC119330896 isoform X7 n=1 Tax=Triticum dicoccoides TaxID=85692 RepID=UPI00188EBE59|nr:uncharacterized protein LOC119330896 isoform X7 [Triticum dicoccoides]
MHTHPRPTHAHTPTSHWIPSLSSSSIPFLHPMPPPDSGDPRGEPRLGTGGGAPRGGPSSVELLLLRAQRRRRGQDGRSPSRYINHLKPARLGDCIEAKANPIRYLDPDAYLDKDQLLDAVHWIRQAVGLACGLLWGAVPLVGAFWIALWSRRTSSSSSKSV